MEADHGTLGSLGHDEAGWGGPAGDGEDVLAAARAAYQEAYGSRLLAVYALGSLAHGGFSPQTSDVDVALVIDDPAQADDADRVLEVATAVRAAGSGLAGRLSVFWGTPAGLTAGTGAGRFPPLDRLCLLEHGRLLAGSDVRTGFAVPTSEELVAAGAAFAIDLLGGEITDQLSQPGFHVSRGLRWVTKLVLFPARFLYTAETGREGTNEVAAQAYVDAGRPGAELVGAALQWRSEVPEVQEVEDLLEHHVRAVYRHYVSDHAQRLATLGQPGLARRFRRWSDRLWAGP